LGLWGEAARGGAMAGGVLVEDRLARLTTGPEREAPVAAAREAWQGINRPDLVADLARELSSGDDSRG
jgi:hypothetical protein